MYFDENGNIIIGSYGGKMTLEFTPGDKVITSSMRVDNADNASYSDHAANATNADQLRYENSYIAKSSTPSNDFWKVYNGEYFSNLIPDGSNFATEKYVDGFMPLTGGTIKSDVHIDTVRNDTEESCMNRLKFSYYDGYVDTTFGLYSYLHDKFVKNNGDANLDTLTAQTGSFTVFTVNGSSIQDIIKMTDLDYIPKSKSSTFKNSYSVGNGYDLVTQRFIAQNEIAFSDSTGTGFKGRIKIIENPSTNTFVFSSANRDSFTTTDFIAESTLIPDGSGILTENSAATQYLTKTGGIIASTTGDTSLVIKNAIINGTPKKASLKVGSINNTFSVNVDDPQSSALVRIRSDTSTDEARGDINGWYLYDEVTRGNLSGIDRDGPYITKDNQKTRYATLDVISATNTIFSNAVLSVGMNNAPFAVSDGKPTTIEHGKFYSFKPHSTADAEITLVTWFDDGEEDEARVFFDCGTAAPTVTFPTGVTVLYEEGSVKFSEMTISGNSTPNRYLAELKWFQTSASGTAVKYVIVNCSKVVAE